MIVSYAYDVEVLPNFFSITIIDVRSYLQTFSDVHDETKKKKPIPLTQKYKVKEIKEKLEKVKKHKFYITDTDDSQLLSMVAFIQNMRIKYDENKNIVRTDMFGYNSNKYDKLMIAGLLMFYNQTNNTKELITKLYELSKKIIDMQDDYEVIKNDYVMSILTKYNLPFKDIDVMKLFALNKVGSGEDDNGNKVYFGKGLKQTSINLQWYELLEYELPDISDKDIHLYKKGNHYKDMSLEQINTLVNKWDRYILDEWIPDMMHYNENDVFIVCEIIRLYIDEIRLRYNISKSYKVDVLDSSRSNIADKLFVKFYSEFSGLTPKQWRGKQTIRTAMSFKKIIFPFINFKTEPLKEMLNEIKQIVIYSLGKNGLKDIAYKYPKFKYLKTNTNAGWFEIKINNLTYTIATGGLHSKDSPRELKSKIEMINPSTGEISWDNLTDNSYIYVHWDIASFYPSIMDVYNIAPAHLNEKIFVKLIHWIKETRISAKHSKDEIIDGIPRELLALALKIVINSIYGKMGFEKSDICDRLAVLKVTINGQLMIMMLCEELELNGIEVISANTDGIVVKLYKKDKEKFDEIANNWKALTKLDADSEEYMQYICRDIDFIGVVTV